MKKPSLRAESPAPKKIRARRERAGLTQTQAAERIYSTLRTWQEWEGGNRTMHPAMWELFCIKTRKAKATQGD